MMKDVEGAGAQSNRKEEGKKVKRQPRQNI